MVENAPELRLLDERGNVVASEGEPIYVGGTFTTGDELFIACGYVSSDPRGPPRSPAIAPPPELGGRMESVGIAAHHQRGVRIGSSPASGRLCRASLNSRVGSAGELAGRTKVVRDPPPPSGPARKICA